MKVLGPVHCRLNIERRPTASVIHVTVQDDPLLSLPSVLLLELDPSFVDEERGAFLGGNLFPSVPRKNDCCDYQHGRHER